MPELPPSALANRHDGVMLGCFLAAAAAEPFASRYSYLRARINEYLLLAEAKIALPEDQKQVTENLGEIFKIVWDHVARRSVELGDFFFIGATAYTSVAQAQHLPDEVAGLKDDLLSKLHAVGLPTKVAEDFWAAAPAPRDSLAVDDFISAVLRLARACIEPLPPEPGTAFVAMPFAEPFATRYRQFYVPLLRTMNYRALRAWGGLSFEDYWELLVALIDRAGALFGDLTGANPNVLHEVGLGEGKGKTAILVMEKGDAEPPSNLGYHAVVMYDPTEDGWPGPSITNVVKILRPRPTPPSQR